MRRGEGGVFRFRAELDGISPPVWRRLLVSDRATLLELHAIVQASFGQSANAMHRFTVDGVTWHDPDGSDHAARATDATTLMQVDLTVGARMTHDTEVGAAAWRHVLTVEEQLPRYVGQRLPVCLAAGGASPPEGVDTSEQYLAMRQALRAPDAERDTDLLEWLPDGFDADFADLAAINAALGEVPRW